MSSYKCIYCDYSTKKSSNYKKHLGTKKHISNQRACDLNLSENICEDLNLSENICEITNKSYNKDLVYNSSISSIKCKYCNKLFKYSRNLNSHYINTCIDIPEKIKNRYIAKHNKNKKTKEKLELVEYNNRGSRIINNNTMNNNITNNIINNRLVINPVGEETIGHIGKDRLLTIISSGDNMLKEFCKDLYSVNDNLNVYLDFRSKLITFVNKENELDIETMNRMLQKLVFTHMDRIKILKKKFSKELPKKALSLFEDTMMIYNCVISKDNMDDEEYIEKQHDILNIRLMEDVKTSIMLIKDKCKRVIESIKSKKDTELE